MYVVASRTKSPVAASSPDDIPPELTGAQKWSTVHIKDGKAPTKASVFLGSQVSLFCCTRLTDISETLLISIQISCHWLW